MLYIFIYQIVIINKKFNKINIKFNNAIKDLNEISNSVFQSDRSKSINFFELYKNARIIFKIIF